MARRRNPLRLPVGKVIALDVETDGLDPYHEARIIGFGYMTEEGEYGYYWKTRHSIDWVRRLFKDKSRTITFHNAKFDLKMFWFEGLDVFNIRATTDCTLILAKLFNEDGSHELEDLGVKYLDRDPDEKYAVTEWLKANKRSFVKRHGRPPNFSDAPPDLVIDRCLWDVETTLYLWYFFRPQVRKMCEQLYNTERDLMLVVMDMENIGVRVNITRARELRAEAVSDLELIQTFLDKAVCPLVDVQRGAKDEDGNYLGELVTQFNPNSNRELEAVWRKLGIRLRYKTKPKKRKGGGKTSSGNWSFDEFAMIRYSRDELQPLIRDSGETGMGGAEYFKRAFKILADCDGTKADAIPALILKYRELSKMVSTYYEAIINRPVDRRVIRGQEYGILHCSFNQSRALTGRFSSSKPNLQNIPRVKGPRECFVPRAGRQNYHFDYSQMEMRIFVHFARDRKMAKAIERDIHLAVAAEIYSKPEKDIISEQRKRAKLVNFGIIYGVGATTLAYNLTSKGLPTTRTEAEALLHNYHRRFPSVRRLNRELKRQLHRAGFIENPYGRRYHVPTKVAYKATNNLVQGTCADLMKQAMVDIWKWLRREGMRSRMIMTIHDEIVLEVPAIERKTITHPVIKMMEDLTSFFVPITADVEVVRKSWSKKEPLERAA